MKPFNSHHCRLSLRGMAALASVLLVLTSACSGSSSSGTSSSGTGTDTSSSTLTLTGTASSPSSTSSSVNALTRGGIRFLEDEPVAEGTTITVDNLNDDSTEAIGTCTTGTDGAWSCEIDEEAVEEDDVLLISGGDIYLYFELPADEDGDGAYDCGEMNLDTTMAWMDFHDYLESLGITDFAAANLDNYAGSFTVDIGCFNTVTEALWGEEEVDVSGDGLAANMAILEYMNAAAMLGDFSGDMHDIDDGDLSDEELAELAEMCETHFGIPADTIENSYDAAVAAADAMDDVLSMFTEATDSGVPSLFQEAGVDYCAEFEADPDFLSVTMQNLTDCGSVADLVDYWGSEESLVAYFSYADSYEGAWAEFNQDAFLGTWGAYAANYDTADGWADFNPTEFGQVYDVILDYNFEGGDESDWYTMGMSVCGSYLDDYAEGGYADFSAWYGTAGTEVVDYWYYNVEVAGLDAYAGDFGADYDWDGQFEEAGDLYDYSLCATDPDACAAYEVPEVEGGYYYTPPAEGETTATICDYDYVCDTESGENSYNCYLDCYSAPPAGYEGDAEDYTYTPPSCNYDDICDEGEDMYSCYSDCYSMTP